MLPGANYESNPPEWELRESKEALREQPDFMIVIQKLRTLRSECADKLA